MTKQTGLGEFHGYRVPAAMWQALGADVYSYNGDTGDSNIDFGGGLNGDRRRGYIIELLERARATKAGIGKDEVVVRQAIVFYAEDRPARSQQDLASALDRAVYAFSEALKRGTQVRIEGLERIVNALNELAPR